MRILLAATGAVLLPVALAAAPAQASSSDAQVSVFHGVPGLTVDVYANGDAILEDFEPGTITDPLTLPAGDYELQVFPAGADPAGEPAIEATATVPAGANITVAAHLSADGAPTLTPFVNDVSSLDAGQARLTARHTAAAPAVDVRAGGTPVFSGVTNPNEGVVELAAGTVSADVALAGTSTVAIGPADLALAEGTATFVHAIGSAEAGDLALVSFTISGLHSSPSGVPAGSGPADSPAATVLLIGLLAAGAGATVLGGRRLLAGRSI